MKTQTIKIRLTTGEVVDLAGGRLVEIGRNETTGRRWGMWQERLESVKRASLDPDEPSWREVHSVVLYEVEPDVWSFDHGDGWPSHLPREHPSEAAQVARRT